MKNMKKLIFIAVLFAGCRQSDTEKLDQMRSPVTVVAKSIGKEGWGGWAVVLKDGDGHIVTLFDTYTAVALASKNVGDTIK